MTRIGLWSPHSVAGPSRLPDARQAVTPPGLAQLAGERLAIFGRRRVLDEVRRLVLRPLLNLLVAQQVGDAEGRDARLTRAKELARAAQLQVDLGDAEPVGGFGHGAQALVRDLRAPLGGEQQAGGAAAP